MAHIFNARQPVGHVRLDFGDKTPSKVPKSLSAVEQIGSSLWLGADESTCVERLSTDDYANYGKHARFQLAEFFPLPDGADEEVDLEGLAWDEQASRLWLVGSHSLRRKRPKPGEAASAAFAALEDVDRRANRHLLGSIELDTAKKRPEPRRGSARFMPFGRKADDLIKRLDGNALLAPFLRIPSKDNGFDIEGIAVMNGVVILGLRGPVVGGWASVLELRFEERRGALKPQPVGRDGRGYLHHVLDLGGLGVRDLSVWNSDLLILAGPAMMLDGPTSLFRWRNAFGNDADRCVDDATLELMFHIPWGERADHAEGIALYRLPERDPRLLVVYDSPAASRLHDGNYFKADLFALW